LPVRFLLSRTAYGPIIAAVSALAELASDAGDLTQARRWARFAASRPSIMQGLADRTLAYVEGTSLRAAADRAAARRQPSTRRSGS
jgi:hypothetical protein